MSEVQYSPTQFFPYNPSISLSPHRFVNSVPKHTHTRAQTHMHTDTHTHFMFSHKCVPNIQTHTNTHTHKDIYTDDTYTHLCSHAGAFQNMRTHAHRYTYTQIDIHMHATTTTTTHTHTQSNLYSPTDMYFNHRPPRLTVNGLFSHNFKQVATLYL